MAKKAEKGKTTYRKGDLWIAPSSSFRRKNYQSDWKLERGEPEGSNRYLQLADVALGLAPVKHRTKRRAA
jgi:hypothetical protein